MDTSPLKINQKVSEKKHEKNCGSKRNEKLHLQKCICSLSQTSSVSRNFVDVCKERVSKSVGVKDLFPKTSIFKCLVSNGIPMRFYSK